VSQWEPVTIADRDVENAPGTGEKLDAPADPTTDDISCRTPLSRDENTGLLIDERFAAGIPAPFEDAGTLNPPSEFPQPESVTDILVQGSKPPPRNEEGSAGGITNWFMRRASFPQDSIVGDDTKAPTNDRPATPPDSLTTVVPPRSRVTEIETPGISGVTERPNQTVSGEPDRQDSQHETRLIQLIGIALGISSVLSLISIGLLLVTLRQKSNREPICVELSAPPLMYEGVRPPLASGQDANGGCDRRTTVAHLADVSLAVDALGPVGEGLHGENEEEWAVREQVILQEILQDNLRIRAHIARRNAA
jgi:hypothetical protein